jgi:hypothetical protein
MALKRHRRMRANPVELLVVNPGKPRRHMNPEWARSLGRGMYRGAHYAAESARDLYRGAREAHQARLVPTTPVKNPGSKKKGSTVAKPKRDSKGRYVKKMAKRKPRKSKGAKSRARRARKSPAAKVVRRRRAKKAAPAVKAVRRRRRARKNPAAKIVRRRRKRANPAMKHRAKRKHRRNPLSKRFQKRAKRAVAVLRARRKKAPKRSLRRRALTAQISRANALLSLSRSRASAKRIRPAIRGLQHAMMTRSNPGMAGVISSFKILAPQAAVGGVGLVGLAMAGKYVADMLTKEKKEGAAEASFKASMLSEGKPTMLAQYAPALSTAALSAVAYVVADKVAPRYKGAVAIGGMIGAIVQAVMVMAEGEDKTSFAAKTKASLLPIPGVPASAQPAAAPDAAAPAAAAAAAAGKTAAGIGEYTTVGSGIFHGVGEYTTIGTGADNRTEFAADSLRGLGEYTTVGSGIFHGLDDASQFAPGEGGILSGGIFR